MKKSNGVKHNWIRRVVQISFFTLILLMVTTQYVKENGVALPWVAPNLHSICPFGAVESIGRLVIQGNLIPKIHESNYWLLLAVVVSTVLIGAVFCSWICPLGSIQDWVGKIGKRLFKKRYNNFVPKKVDNLLGYFRYIVLGLIVIQTTRLINLVFSSFDPYYALFHFWTGEALPSAIVVLIIVLVSSLFISRPWCRWFCPFGALLGLFQLISPWKIRRNTLVCINCTKCSKSCPMGIDVAHKEKVIDTRCNRCGECLASCPIKNGLDHSLPGKIKLSLKNRIISAIVVIVLFMTPIIISTRLGLFKTSENPVIMQGDLKLEDIKSSLTLTELAIGFGMDFLSLKEYLLLPENVTGNTKLRDVEDYVEELTVKAIREKMKTIK